MVFANAARGSAANAHDTVRVADQHTNGLGTNPPEAREQLSVEAAQQLLIEGQNLPIDPELLAKLRHNLGLVQEWEVKLEEVGQRQVCSDTQFKA